MSRLPLALVLLVTALAAAAPATAAPAGRAFSLGRVAASDIAVAPDGTVYASFPTIIGIRRLRPQDTTFATFGLPGTATAQILDLEVAADGALLWIDGANHRLWRRAPDGTVAPVAGLDGVCPTAIANTPGGGLLLVDNFSALRVLEPGAPLRTIWPAGEPVDNRVCYDGGNGVTDTTMTPDGTAYALVLGGLLAVSPDGTAKRVLELGDEEAVDAGPDAGLTITRARGIYRWAPGLTAPVPVMRFTFSAEDRLFDRDGDTLARFGAAVSTHSGAVATGDGGLALPVQTPDQEGRTRVAYLPGPRPARLALALRGRDGRLGPRGYSAALRLTRPARVVVTVIRRGRTRARVTRRLGAGPAAVTLGRGLPFGAATVRVAATGSDGQAARDSLRLFLGDTLPVATARREVPGTYDVNGCYRSAAGDPPTARAADCDTDDRPTTVTACVRRDARRVDCAYTVDDHGDRLCRVQATRLSAVGALQSAEGRFTCPRAGRVVPPLRRRPAWGSGRLPRS